MWRTATPETFWLFHDSTDSNKDLSLVPKIVTDMENTAYLDLSVNNLKRLPAALWTLPLHKLDLSHNRYLGRALMSVLESAARCRTLKELLLRDIVTTAGLASWVMHVVAPKGARTGPTHPIEDEDVART